MANDEQHVPHEQPGTGKTGLGFTLFGDVLTPIAMVVALLVGNTGDLVVVGLGCALIGLIRGVVGLVMPLIVADTWTFDECPEASVCRSFAAPRSEGAP